MIFARVSGIIRNEVIKVIMVRLLIIRHAKTEWNKIGRIQGMSDIPLTEESRIAAREAANALAGYDIAAVYSSPLVRARETAELITNRQRQIITDSRLIERDFGIFEGRTYEELGLPDHTKLFYELDSDVYAEPSDEVFDRARSFVLDMLELYDGKTVLVVSHGVCISFLIYAATHDKWDKNSYDLNYIKNLTATVVEVRS